MQHHLKKAGTGSYRYFAAYKPYGMLTQFTDKELRPTLASLYNFPADVYPVGRLDMDSEGLVLLTNDKILNYKLLDPKFRHEREYFVQVEGIPKKEALKNLEAGVVIERKKTLPAKVKFINEPLWVPERVPPIRVRKYIPTSWISIILTEGRNRQVRKMTAHIGHPTLRLIRVRIGKLKLSGINAGEVREFFIAEEPVL